MYKFFLKLEIVYLKSRSDPKLLQVGLNCFRDVIFDEMSSSFTDAFLEAVQTGRDGEVVDSSMMKATVDVFEAMGMGSLSCYEQSLEARVLEATRQFYTRKRDEWIDKSTTTEYLQRAKTSLDDEQKLIANFMPKRTEQKIQDLLRHELLMVPQDILTTNESSGCKALLRNDRSEDLQLLFQLYELTENGLEKVADLVQEYICDHGMAIVSSREERMGKQERNTDPIFVKALIEIHDKFLDIVERYFFGNALFHRALKNAFEEVVNDSRGEYTNAELFASFCDGVLRDGKEKLSESEVEQYLDKTVQLFRYLRDKDVFVGHYRDYFAKRMLNQRSRGQESEKAVISKLKIQCGTQFTSKLEGMFADLTTGAEKRDQFSKSPQRKLCSIDFGVQALTAGYWPFYAKLDVVVTEGMKACMQQYAAWHKNNHKGTKLSWIMTQGYASVKATFGSSSYDLHLTTLQAVALIEFNDNVSLTLDALKKKLNLDDSILKPLMHSLSCGKYKLIEKKPPNSKVLPSDTFTSNKKFSSKLRKIRVPMASLDKRLTHDAVERDRTQVIEAAIVRIMKARKVLRHQELVAEVLHQLSFFRPNVRDIKKRIEALIDREYLARDSSDTPSYKYLA